jgi:hypothetical protein
MFKYAIFHVDFYGYKISSVNVRQADKLSVPENKAVEKKSLCESGSFLKKGCERNRVRRSWGR